MSRDLEAAEAKNFEKLYAKGSSCVACGSKDVTIRIWEGYNSPAKAVGGDLGPQNIVAAIVICKACGHGETVPRSHIMGSKAA